MSLIREALITDITGVTVGHAQNYEGGSGCTAILYAGNYLTACDVRGGGPATKETELLKPECANKGVQGIMLSGGAAFGLVYLPLCFVWFVVALNKGWLD